MCTVFEKLWLDTNKLMRSLLVLIRVNSTFLFGLRTCPSSLRNYFLVKGHRFVFHLSQVHSKAILSELV